MEIQDVGTTIMTCKLSKSTQVISYQINIILCISRCDFIDREWVSFEKQDFSLVFDSSHDHRRCILNICIYNWNGNGLWE